MAVFKDYFIFHLLNLPDPAVYARLQLVQEGGVFNFIPEVGDLGLLPTLVALLGDVADNGVDEQADLWNLNVLLKMEQAHLQLCNLLLHRRSHLIAIPEKQEGWYISVMLNAINLQIWRIYLKRGENNI